MEIYMVKVESTTKKGAHVTPGFMSLYQACVDEPLGTCVLADLFALVCEQLDEAVVSDDTCLILGSRKDRTAYAITVKWKGNTISKYGADARAMLTALVEFWQMGNGA